MTDPHHDVVDVVDVLTADHHEVLDLVATIATTADARERRDLTDTVIAEIVRHSVAEEMYVYPAIRRHVPEGDTEVAHDVADHQRLEETMKQLEGKDAGDLDFLALVATLEQQLRDHAGEEEDHQFPQLREAVPPETLRELATQVQRAKQIAPTRPHPGSPHAELFHKAFGPGVGLVDKLRDAVTGRARNT